MEHQAREPVVERRERRRGAVPARPERRPVGGLPNRTVRALLGEGTPLDGRLRAQFEARLGADLGDVRVHTGATAADSAEALSARAYTYGRDIVFGPGEYRPQSPGGRDLLLHELVHVQQQTLGGSAPAGSRQAEHAAADTARGAAGGPRAALAGTAPGIARQAKPGAPEAAEPDDSLGPVGDLAVEVVSQRIAGSGLQQQMAAAAMRGFVAELGRQLKPGDQLARFKSSLKELAIPANAGRFVGGYAAGAAAGFISPATDLLGLGALAEQLPAIAASLGKRAWNQAAALAAEAREIAASIAEFDRVARAKIVELLKDPAQLYLLLSTMGPRAVAAAGEAGRTAASQVVGLFSGKDEPAEKTDASVAQALTTTTEEERSGVFSFLTSKATRLRKVWFSTPWSKLGYEVGHAIGAIISNLLLLIFSEGIGNAIAKIGAWLGEVAPFLARGAKAVVSLGRVVESIEKAIGLLLAKGVKLIKPLEAIIAPLFRMMERLQGFLRRLFGVAEHEAGALLAKGGATIAEESGARGLAGGTGAAEEAGARAAAPGGTTARPAPAATAKAPPGAETPPANVVPLKGAKRPPVSKLTKAQQAGLSRAPKGSRSVGTVHGGEVPPGATPHAQPVPEALPAAEEVPLARTGTDDPHAGSVTDAPKAVGSGSGGPPPSRTPPPQATSAAGPPKRTAGATPPRVVRPVPAPKGRPPVRGATAEGVGPDFKLEYHEPVGEVPQQRARAGARPAQREGVQPAGQAPKREPFAARRGAPQPTPAEGGARAEGGRAGAAEEPMTKGEEIAAELEQYQERAEAGGDVQAELLESGLSERPEFRSPSGSSKIVTPGSSVATGDATSQALMEHVEAAQERFNAEGFTQAQTEAIDRLPTAKKRNNARARFYGERIDSFVKQSIQGDRRLDHLGVSEIKQPGPDFFDPETKTWYDITTAKSWKAHVRKYWSSGRGVRIPSGR